eukprot:6111944-Amphidinium_carterae.1
MRTTFSLLTKFLASLCLLAVSWSPFALKSTVVGIFPPWPCRYARNEVFDDRGRRHFALSTGGTGGIQVLE